MRTPSRIGAAALTISVASLSLSPALVPAGETPLPAEATPLPAEATPLPAEATPTLFGMELLLNGRLRYEYADQAGREESNALTWRHRAGVQTREWLGLSALAELEHTWALLGEDHYNPYPRAGRTVIADPENFELNRLQLDYRNDLWDSHLTAGRQEIMLDDQRFVGNVGWRQNEQTYDAVRLQTSPVEALTLNYAYLTRVNRIFGENAPASNLSYLDSDSHLINLRSGQLTAFAYLLDFDEMATVSTQTYGLRLNGKRAPGGSAALLYDLQWAMQQDYAGNANDYSAQFYRVEGGVDLDEAIQIGAGYEVLGEDNGASFQTPLGTNHKFNGYADAFLSTPASGLRDLYAYVGGSLPAGIDARLTYHHFRSDVGNDSLGNELDLTLGRKLGDHASALLEAAYLEGDGAQPDIQRFSFQIDYKF